jgi:hypothetical protein
VIWPPRRKSPGKDASRQEGLADPAAACYGADLSCLREIERRIDPDGVFLPPRRQGIDQVPWNSPENTSDTLGVSGLD